MERRTFIKNTVLAGAGLTLSNSVLANNLSSATITKKILLSGGIYDLNWFHYMISLTGKDKPKVCFLPTASGDNQFYIDYWFKTAKDLPVEPFVQKVFISSSEQKLSFEESLLGMDAILVPGGNTLDMMALWKIHGIDLVLKKAWEKGIVLTGSSAGAVCWFQQGLSDSRPKQLSAVDGLGFFEGSCCPHYHSTNERSTVYQEMISKGTIMPGYGLDNNAGLYFENNKIARVIASDKTSKVYKVSAEGGKIVETALDAEVLG
ncbi:Type 1 glutamine amidotransferase-like domain-containing protein [Mucilaginibacter sp.]|uniref:Type 1 glutamine amidotransferase-like domain-containing protein n=1 Tax=Mucilaginibacter sp. TaxID=1882438 RepID=UPI003D11CC24